MSSTKDLNHLRLPFEDIQQSTNNFTTLIGRGGYGPVYRGQLSLSAQLTLLVVAVKRLQIDNLSGQGLKEFLTEIQLLSRYKHQNLVSLVGFCEQGNEKFLIYEYAEHRSLDRYLKPYETRCPLTWMQRIKICIDAARGLDHLHNHVAQNERVIHRDVKSANILLDRNWKALIADFGLSKIGRANEQDTYLITNACGTYGYCDPAYLHRGILTKESDVYSFGVVLLEVLCGRLCVININSKERFLVPLAKSYYKDKRLNLITDPCLKSYKNSDSVKVFSEIVFQCLQDDRESRPSIGLVLQKLEKALKFLEKEDAPELLELEEALKLQKLVERMQLQQFEEECEVQELEEAMGLNKLVETMQIQQFEECELQVQVRHHYKVLAEALGLPEFEDALKVQVENLTVKAVDGHFRALVSQLLQAENLFADEEKDSWLEIITSLAWEAASLLKSDMRKSGGENPSGYVKIKCLASGRRADSILAKGVVCKKNVAHRWMTSEIKKPRFLILGGALEYQHVSNRLSSFDDLVQQEKDYLKMVVQEIVAHQPDILLVEKSVSRDAQEYLLAKGISLVLNIRRPLLERIARCTGTQIVPSIDSLSSPELGRCDLFHVQRFHEEHRTAGQGSRKQVKTLMYFEGCPKPSGWTILLRGASDEELKKVKHVVAYAVFAAYHLAVDASFIAADEGASPSEMPLNPAQNVGPLDKPSNV